MTEAAIPAASDLLNSSVLAPTPPPPAPAWQPAGLPVAPPAFHAPEAVAARATIEERKGNKDLYKLLVAERERGLTGPASQEWAGLHKTGYRRRLPSRHKPTSTARPRRVMSNG